MLGLYLGLSRVYLVFFSLGGSDFNLEIAILNIFCLCYSLFAQGAPQAVQKGKEVLFDPQTAEIGS